MIHPNLFLNNNEIAIIKSRIINNEQPWKSSFDKLIANANYFKNSYPDYNSIPSILLGATPPSGDKHDYFSQAPYCYWNTDPGCTGDCCSPCGGSCCDGKVNPCADRTDYENIQKLRDAIRYFGLAYQLTGNNLYADRAIDWIKKWCIDPNYMMSPRFPCWTKPDGSSDCQPILEIAYNMVGVCYGADLIWNYSGWGDNEKNAFISFLSSLLSNITVKNDGTDDGWGESKSAFVSATSIMTDNTARRDDIFNTWKGIVDRQVDTNGSIKNERNRTTGLSYSAVYISQMMGIAEMAYHQGIDLYHYKISGTNRGIELVLDFHAPYIKNPTGWPYNNSGPIYYKCTGGKCLWTSDTTGYYRDMTCGHSTICTWLYHGQYAHIFDLGYTRIAKKQSYIDATLQWRNLQWGDISGGCIATQDPLFRCTYDDRNLGPTTLTHGSSFGAAGCLIPVSRMGIL